MLGILAMLLGTAASIKQGFKEEQCEIRNRSEAREAGRDYYIDRDGRSRKTDTGIAFTTTRIGSHLVDVELKKNGNHGKILKNHSRDEYRKREADFQEEYHEKWEQARLDGDLSFRVSANFDDCRRGTYLTETGEKFCIYKDKYATSHAIHFFKTNEMNIREPEGTCRINVSEKVAKKLGTCSEHEAFLGFGVLHH